MAVEEHSVESAFAANLRNARTSAKMTQADLAEAMAKQGFKWHGPTVYKVEALERQVLLSEALALAQILGVTVERLTQPNSALSLHVRMLMQDFIRAELAATRALSELSRCTEGLRSLLAQSLDKLVVKFAAPRFGDTTAAATQLQALLESLASVRDQTAKWADTIQAWADQAGDVTIWETDAPDA